MPKIGDTIKIVDLNDEPYSSNYIGKTGKVTGFNKDCYGLERMSGTWGSIYIYVNEDKYEVVNE